MSIVLADLGGTHLRLARADSPSDIQKFKIADHPTFESVLRDYAPDITALYLASAITPLNGMIEDKRFGDHIHWRIDLSALGCKTIVLNDLEAATYGLSILKDDQVQTLLSAKVPQVHFDHPPKLLIGIGTGVGHAFLFEKYGAKPFVQRTHGAHVPAFGVTDDQQEIIALLKSKLPHDRDLIMENIIGGNGLWTLGELVGKDKATRAFWEFLGIYCNMLVTGAASYGGVYLTGGIIDDMIDEQAIDAETFEHYFIRPLVEVVVEGLSATPVYICRDVNLPIQGLSHYAREAS